MLEDRLADLAAWAVTSLTPRAYHERIPRVCPITMSSRRGDGAPSTTIQPATLRNLGDKLYEKRKQGAVEIENLVKELKNNRNEAGIQSVVKTIVEQYASSIVANQKKGGLISLAAIAIGLGMPVVHCF